MDDAAAIRGRSSVLIEALVARLALRRVAVHLEQRGPADR